MGDLRFFPEKGHPGRIPETREFTVPRLPYIVTYRLKQAVAEVAQIRHGARIRHAADE